MAAVGAVDEEVLLVDINRWGDWVWAHVHAGVLPGVLDSVEEEDVVTSVVQSTVGKVGHVRAWWQEVWVEDSLAVVGPEGLVQSWRSHWVVLVGLLPPSERGAVLVSPLSEILVDVNCRV